MKRYLNQTFLFLFLLLAGIILIICFTGTFHHIPFLFIFGIACIWLAAFFLLFFLANKWKRKLDLISDKWVLFFLFIWGILLFLFGNYIKGEPASDYWYIYTFLTDWINQASPDWSYFAWWENNLPLLYLFAPVVKLGHFLGVTDIQYSLAVFNTIMLAGSGYGIYLLIRKGFPDLKNNTVVRWMALLFYMGFIPVWGSVFYVYSDSASMFFAVIGMMLYSQKQTTPPAFLLLLRYLHGYLLADKAYGLPGNNRFMACATCSGFILQALETDSSFFLRRPLYSSSLSIFRPFSAPSGIRGYL